MSALTCWLTGDQRKIFRRGIWNKKFLFIHTYIPANIYTCLYYIYVSIRKIRLYNYFSSFYCTNMWKRNWIFLDVCYYYFSFCCCCFSTTNHNWYELIDRWLCVIVKLNYFWYVICPSNVISNLFCCY